jgi:hypothetical protein
MVSIVELAYKVVAGWMRKQAVDTENKEFIAKVDSVLKTVEELWIELKKQLGAK